MIELNKIYNEDCLEGMKRIPDKSVDMILCDLPYGTTKCKWDTVLPFERLWEQYKRIIKDRGQIVLFATEPFTSQLVSSNLKWYREHLTWIKSKPSNFASAKYVHMKYTEDIITFGNGSGTYNPQMQPRISRRVEQAHKSGWERNATNTSIISFSPKNPRNIPSSNWDANWKYPMDYLNFNQASGKEKTIHQTQKPVKLFEYLIKTYSNMGETVLDNCIGSGTTAIACLNTNRNFIGFELNKEYFEIAQNRIEKRQNEISLLDVETLEVIE